MTKLIWILCWITSIIITWYAVYVWHSIEMFRGCEVTHQLNNVENVLIK